MATVVIPSGQVTARRHLWWHFTGVNDYELGDMNPDDTIEIPPHYNWFIGYITLIPGTNVRIQRGDKLWYSFAGLYNAPKVPIYNSFYTNRNFGTVTKLKRSNTAQVGWMQPKTYLKIHEFRANQLDQSGPRQGQHFATRTDVFAWDNHRGQVDEYTSLKVIIVQRT